MRPLRGVVILSVTVVLLAFGARAGLRWKLAGEVEATRLSPEHFELLLADVEVLRTDPPFGACGTHDAGEVLNPLLALDDGKHPAESSPWWAEGAVAEALRAKGTRWLDHVEDGPRGDLSITATLLQYDTWNSTSSGPGAALLAAGDPGMHAWEYPIPMMVPFQVLAKLRLLEGLRTGDMLPALREVRHLAEVVSCEDWLVAQFVAVALLGIEADGYGAAVGRGLLTPDAWKPASKETRDRMKGVTLAMTGVYAGWGPEGGVARLEALEGPVFGRCAAIAEAAAQWMILRPYLGEPWPLEIDHLAPTRALDTVLAGTSCRLAVTRSLWGHPEWEAELPVEGEERWSRLPYVRDLAFYRVVQISAVDHDPYD